MNESQQKATEHLQLSDAVVMHALLYMWTDITKAFTSDMEKKVGTLFDCSYYFM